jgi:hypothetical protein
MNYNKPTIAVLGSAVGVIQGHKTTGTVDPPNHQLIPDPPPPAYELDE